MPAIAPAERLRCRRCPSCWQRQVHRLQMPRRPQTPPPAAAALLAPRAAAALFRRGLCPAPAQSPSPDLRQCELAISALVACGMCFRASSLVTTSLFEMETTHVHTHVWPSPAPPNTSSCHPAPDPSFRASPARCRSSSLRRSALPAAAPVPPATWRSPPTRRRCHSTPSSEGAAARQRRLAAGGPPATSARTAAPSVLTFAVNATCGGNGSEGRCSGAAVVLDVAGSNRHVTEPLLLARMRAVHLVQCEH